VRLKKRGRQTNAIRSLSTSDSFSYRQSFLFLKKKKQTEETEDKVLPSFFALSIEYSCAGPWRWMNVRGKRVPIFPPLANTWTLFLLFFLSFLFPLEIDGAVERSYLCASSKVSRGNIQFHVHSKTPKSTCRESSPLKWLKWKMFSRRVDRKALFLSCPRTGHKYQRYDSTRGLFCYQSARRYPRNNEMRSKRLPQT